MNPVTHPKSIMFLVLWYTLQAGQQGSNESAGLKQVREGRGGNFEAARQALEQRRSSAGTSVDSSRDRYEGRAGVRGRGSTAGASVDGSRAR